MNIRNKVFWALDALKGGKYNKEVKRIQFLLSDTTDNQIKIKEHYKSLQNTLQYAHKHVPYYKSLDVTDSLASFPIIKKEMIRANINDFISDEVSIDKLAIHSTSGSTGTPFKFYVGPEKVFSNHCSFLFHNIETGYEVGDKVYFLRSWSSDIVYSKWKMWRSNLAMGDCNPTEKNIKKLQQTIDKSYGIVMQGYASALIAYAKMMNQQEKGKIKVIYTGSDQLSDKNRHYLTQVFNCPVFSRYANEEVGIISQQTNMDSPVFRVNIPMVHVEILKQDSDEPANPGEVGRIILTDLTRKSMPFIRYETGDLASYDEGFMQDGVLLYMNNVEGRTLDYILTPEGIQLNGMSISNLEFWENDTVITYQFIQDEKDKYRMLVVPRSNFNSQELQKELMSVLGQNANIQIETTSDIPLTKSGKRRYIVNKLV